MNIAKKIEASIIIGILIITILFYFMFGDFGDKNIKPKMCTYVVECTVFYSEVSLLNSATTVTTIKSNQVQAVIIAPKTTMSEELKKVMFYKIAKERPDAFGIQFSDQILIYPEPQTLPEKP